METNIALLASCHWQTAFTNPSPFFVRVKQLPGANSASCADQCTSLSFGKRYVSNFRSRQCVQVTAAPPLTI